MKPLLLAAATAAALSACGGARNDPLPHSYDFGIGTPAASLPPIRVGQVRAAVPFDSVEMYYRLAFRNPAELVAFTQSRWAAPPAEMYRKRLLRALPAGTGRCTLEVELHEVTQVFGARDSSEALLELRARIAEAGGSPAERMFRVSQPGAGADGPAGAAAMAQAADRSIAELAAWVATVRGCAASG